MSEQEEAETETSSGAPSLTLIIDEHNCSDFYLACVTNPRQNFSTSVCPLSF